MNPVSRPARYLLSFTTGALHLRAAQMATSEFLAMRDWDSVRAWMRSANILQTRTAQSSKVESLQLIQRLSTLTAAELDLLNDATRDEARQLMWAATCRRYTLIGEFAEEVLRERFLLMQPTLEHAHFDAFFTEKTLWHDELTRITESTYRKLRSNLFSMLREAELITDERVIVPTVIAARVRPHLQRGEPSDIRFFPTREEA